MSDQPPKSLGWSTLGPSYLIVRGFYETPTAIIVEPVVNSVDRTEEGAIPRRYVMLVQVLPEAGKAADPKSMIFCNNGPASFPCEASTYCPSLGMVANTIAQLRAR